MLFEEFNKIFEGAMKTAIRNAEEQLNQKLPSGMKIALHGAGYSGELLDPLVAAKQLYLGKDKFYRIIDVAVIKVSKIECTIFVRASSHTPGNLDKTWNNPIGSGPFKQLITKDIIIE